MNAVSLFFLWQGKLTLSLESNIYTFVLYNKAQLKICVFRVTCPKIVGSVRTHFFKLFFWGEKRYNFIKKYLSSRKPEKNARIQQ